MSRLMAVFAREAKAVTWLTDKRAGIYEQKEQIFWDKQQINSSSA